MVGTQIGVCSYYHQLCDTLVIGQRIENTIHPLLLIEFAFVLGL